MNKLTLFYGAIAIAVIALILAVYYIIPGVYHPLTSAPATDPHYKHAIGFAAIAVVCVLAALINRPRTAVR